MIRFLDTIKRNYVHELPIIKLYSLLYLAGVFIGVVAAVLLRSNFSAQAQLLFAPESSPGIFSAFIQHITCFLLLFFLGLTVIGIPLLPLYPLYKGFSIGLLISLATILSGVRGLFFGTLAFFAQNALYTLLGYFICYSSARLSIALLELLKGHGKHGASRRELMQHIACFLIIVPVLLLVSVWEAWIVPLVLNLF